MSVASALWIVAVVALRRPKASESRVEADIDSERRTLEPPVRDVSVEGDEVVVDFAVPLPQDADERLTRLLMAQAVETVRAPRDAARTILDFGLPAAVVWQALALVVVVSVLIGVVMPRFRVEQSVRWFLVWALPLGIAAILVV